MARAGGQDARLIPSRSGDTNSGEGLPSACVRRGAKLERLAPLYFSIKYYELFDKPLIPFIIPSSSIAFLRCTEKPFWSRSSQLVLIVDIAHTERMAMAQTRLLRSAFSHVSHVNA